jgi:hypothetical protein
MISKSYSCDVYKIFISDNESGNFLLKKKIFIQMFLPLQVMKNLKRSGSLFYYQNKYL